MKSYPPLPNWAPIEPQHIPPLPSSRAAGIRVPDPGPVSASPAPAGSTLNATARVVMLEEGLHGIHVKALGLAPSDVLGIALPVIEVSAPDIVGRSPVVVLMGTGDALSWLDSHGGTVVARAPPGGGSLVITTYFAPDQGSVPVHISVERL